MIKSFKHKGLERFFESGSTAGIQPAHARKLRLQLAALEMAKLAEAMNIAGWAFHPLKGNLKDHYSVRVNGNWRLTFKFENGHAIVVDYQDYH